MKNKTKNFTHENVNFFCINKNEKSKYNAFFSKAFFASAVLSATFYGEDIKNDDKNEAKTYETQAITTSAHSKDSYQISKQTTITSKDIIERQVQNSKELLQSDSSISVGGGGNGAQKIYVRGLEDRMLRVTIDGAAQNGNAFHHQGNVQIDPFMLKQVVVSKGAASASTGPGALGGAINFTTKDASDLLGVSRDFGADVNAGFNTNLGYKFGGSIYKRIYKDFGILAYFNQINVINYRDGNHAFGSFLNFGSANTVVGSNSYQNNMLLKASGAIDENQTLSISYNITNDNATRPYRSNIANPKAVNPALISQTGSADNASELFRHDITSKNFSTSYEYNPTNTKLPSAKITIYDSSKNVKLTPLTFYDPSQQSSVKDEDTEGKLKRAIVLNNYGSDIKFKNNLFNNAHILEYGLNYQGISARDDAINQQNNRGEENTQIWGGYVQDTYNINEQWMLGFGSRYDVYYYFDKNSQNSVTQGFSPSLNLAYYPLDGLELNLRYAYTTRGPQPIDAILLRRNDEVQVVTPIKNLRAEKAQNAEFDIDYTNDNFNFSGGVFINRIDDYINSYASHSHGVDAHDAHDIESGRVNLTYPLITYGFETSAHYHFNNFEVNVGASRSWLTAGGIGGYRLLSDTYELGATWGYSFVLGAKYSGSNFDISWLSRFVTGFENGTMGWNIYSNEIEDISKPGYSVSNLYFTYYPKGRGGKFALDFSILNIFNATYIDPTSPLKVEADDDKSSAVNLIRAALYEPGIDFRVNFRYKF